MFIRISFILKYLKSWCPLTKTRPVKVHVEATAQLSAPAAENFKNEAPSPDQIIWKKSPGSALSQLYRSRLSEPLNTDGNT